MDRLGGEFDAYGAGRDFGDGEQDGYADDGAHSNPPPSPVGQDERRMQVRAYNHWSSLLGSETLPHIEDLEPEFLGDFGPYSVLLDFSTGSGTPTIQFIGKELSRECRLDDVVETLQDIPRDSLLAKIAENYLQVVSAQAPVSFEAESANAKGRTVAYRGILLPYSSDFDTIDFVYAVINWKEIADASTADALLEEIDRAMDYGVQPTYPQFEGEPDSTAEIVHFDAHNAEEELDAVNATEEDDVAREDNILELRGAADSEPDAFDGLPTPSFGHEEEGSGEDVWGQPTYSEPDAVGSESYDAPAAPKRNRGLDALGNPVGGMAADESLEEDAAPNGITTAADYGLPEWDDEESEEDDVDDLVNPLADIDLNSRLLSLVNAGTRGKKTVDLATLSDSASEEEDESSEERELFRPKAPSVDTLLSPEPYDEDDESEFETSVAFDYVASETPAYDYAAPSGVDDVEASDTSEVASDWQSQDENTSVATHDVVEHEFGQDSVELEAAAIDPPLDVHNEVVSEELYVEAPAEPLELDEEMILEDVMDVAVEDEFRSAEEQNFPDEAVHATDEPAEAVESEATVEENAPAALVEAETGESGETTVLPQGQESESLTGLLAAVRELTEAARNTEDLGRRALYEAVGRAFDVSIKAVIASERHAGESQGVVEQFPLDAVSQVGPELALVMVRRNADGQTEVVGEVPHDSILMETATLKLASK